MKRNNFLRMRLMAPVAALVFAVGVMAAEDSSSVRLALERTGVDIDAAGSVQSVLKPQRSMVIVQVSGLTPGANYSFNVGAIPQVTFVSDERGRGRLQFTSPGRKNAQLLDFDPRGEEVTVSTGGDVVLRGVVSGNGEPAGISVDESVSIGTLDDHGGRASARYRVTRTGKRQFSVSLSNAADDDWALYVDGIKRGELEVRGGRGRLIFDDDPSASDLLDFDPRGDVIDLVRGTNVVFSGELRARGRGASLDTPQAKGAVIPSTGVDPDGTARARYRVESDARRKFSVELEDVPVGSYELFADGLLQGLINVGTTLDGTEGEIEFSNRSDDSDELPLAFDPLAANFVVRLGATIYFEGAMAAATPAFTNGPASLRESLTSTGADLDASGDARYEVDDRGRVDFDVEIEDVAIGAYELWIGGRMRGTIVAQLVDTRVEGEIQFSSGDDDADELPLQFNPFGELIEVKAGGVVYFSHVFGIGATNGGMATTPIEIDLPLFSLGATASATAKMEFKRDERNRKSFEVEIEDAPAGVYTLKVGGAAQAMITVSAVDGGTRGEVQFEDEPDAADLPLSFDPQGRLITIEKDGVVLFERVLPTS